MNLDISKIRFLIGQSLAGQTARWVTDERRVRLFLAAVQKKSIEIAATGDVDNLQIFAIDSGSLAAQGVLIAQKMQFPKDGIRVLFGYDPYHDWRNQVRTFADRWKLDPLFIQEMGPKN